MDYDTGMPDDYCPQSKYGIRHLVGIVEIHQSPPDGCMKGCRAIIEKKHHGRTTGKVIGKQIRFSESRSA